MQPPRWADRFLEWYCHPQLLEEIQGDSYELFYREVKTNKSKARIRFVWNVIRFFRWKNIRPMTTRNSNSNLSAAMIKNMLLTTIRNFFRHPGQSFLNVFGLATGFTCAFLILLWVTQEYSFDRFHNENDKLFKVLTHVNADGNTQTYDAASAALNVSSVPEIDQLVSVSGGSRWPHELCFRPEGKLNECIYKNGVYASATLFSVLNFPIVEGDPDPLKGQANIAISESMAATLYGDESAVGKLIKIDDTREVMIVSVFKDIPANSSLQFDFAMPFSILKKQWGINDEMLNRNFFQTYLKTQSEISAIQLNEKLNDVSVVTEEYKREKIRYEAYPIADWRLQNKFVDGKVAGGRVEYVVLFIIIASLIVIMAVINFVNMSTARATLRAKEIGVRKVTGAMKGAIAAQFIGESFLIVLVAFVISIITTQLVLPAFNLLISEPIQINLLSGYIPYYLILFLFVVAFLAGIYPAVIMSSFQPAKILKNQFGNTTGSHRFRNVLLTIQITVSIGVIIFTAVLYSQLNFITSKNLGFDRSNVIRVEPTIKIIHKFENFKNELVKNSFIASVGAAASNPLDLGGSNTGVNWQGKDQNSKIAFKTLGCSFEFPETMGLKIVQGRNFTQTSQDSLRTEVLVTQEAVKIMGMTNPVGEEISIGDSKCVIIGVVNDFHTESLHEVRLPVILHRVTYDHVSAVYVRYESGKTQEALQAVKAAYSAIEPRFAMRYWFQDETFNEIYKTETVASRLVLVFSIVVIVIAVVGMVGLTTFNIIRKNKEISVRRVFGASMNQILIMLFSDFTIILIVSILIAAPVAWYASSNWLNKFAYHAPMPYVVFAIAFIGVASMIALIIWIQSLKTISVNPTETLRSE